VWTAALTTCTVPDLKHKTLAQAKTMLRKAACSLGKVKGPKSHQSKRHVTSQSIRAKSNRPAGTKVNLTVR
jgi:beta-lactam-binding protein with PASTA domain